MTFTGYFSLDGTEIANSSRVVSHLGRDVPTSDVGVLTGVGGPTDFLVEDPPGSGLYVPSGVVESPPGSGLYPPAEWMVENPPGSGLYIVDAHGHECELTEFSDGLLELADSMTYISEGLYTPPDGSRRWSEGLLYVPGPCWQAQTPCGSCRSLDVSYDDSWPGLRDLLGDAVYRMELAPWSAAPQPESAEFLGVWVMSVTGLDVADVDRPVAEMAGSGAAPGPHRDKSRTVTFEALLIGCTNAGVTYGLQWLTCALRDTNTRTDAVLRYLAAHPGGSMAAPNELMREVHGVILTKSPSITDQFRTTSDQNRQAAMYRVTWELTVLHPYAYYPTTPTLVEWDSIAVEPIQWVHAADCDKPDFCEDMPVLFSAECVPEVVDIVNAPPPVCGGCLPLCSLESYVYEVPVFDTPYRCRETAVNLVVENTGEGALTLQAYWRVRGSNQRCDDQRHRVQISGLPVNTTLELNSVAGRYWAIDEDGLLRRPRGIVGTPNGAPWQPTVLDRQTAWEFVVQAAPGAAFDVTMTLADREA